MKWRKVVCFTLIFCFLSGSLVQGQSIAVDEVDMHVASVMAEDRTLVPFRDFFEGLGYGVAWDGQLQRATAQKGGQRIMVVVDQSKLFVNHVESQMPGAVTRIEGTVYVSLHFMAEAMGYEVFLDAETAQIKLRDTKDPVERQDNVWRVNFFLPYSFEIADRREIIELLLQIDPGFDEGRYVVLSEPKSHEKEVLAQSGELRFVYQIGGFTTKNAYSVIIEDGYVTKVVVNGVFSPSVNMKDRGIEPIEESLLVDFAKKTLNEDITTVAIEKHYDGKPYFLFVFENGSKFSVKPYERGDKGWNVIEDQSMWGRYLPVFRS